MHTYIYNIPINYNKSSLYITLYFMHSQSFYTIWERERAVVEVEVEKIKWWRNELTKKEWQRKDNTRLVTWDSRRNKKKKNEKKRNKNLKLKRKHIKRVCDWFLYILIITIMITITIIITLNLTLTRTRIRTTTTTTITMHCLYVI